MKFRFPKFDTVGAPLLAVLGVALLVLETRRQLRKPTQPKQERLLQNASVAALALPALRLLLLPALYAAARWSGKHRAGLLPLLRLPGWLNNIAGFLLLDYSNYLWHVLLHRLDVLWRFHNVHHIDLDLDVSTAWRFHIGENIASVPFRGAMMALLGVPARLVVVYEFFFEACTAFHHSNMRLPWQLEQQLVQVVVTPRMHGIHHSIVAQETNSNFSVIFTFWDRLHRTLQLHVPQEDITIGAPAYRNLEEQTPLWLLQLPFQKQRAWKLPDGTTPERASESGRHLPLLP
ncbi:sterol desaturase family protein [Pontibacter qinzhouensis]|uniref:Sterol desaturase family protein n=1 Tax=Pontibacter qinzhouensis TaxID=2603253 RepID=A0A5C8KBZ0_9BACT|nr:sterol desaturase family protein [Pontibacter qinzhouensis]TXK51961.1 sterol desaturase family protein [Pontibacter qinzhouensis]